MGSRICLDVVEPEAGKDSVIPVTEAGLPVLRGSDAEHAACGACRHVLAWNTSPASLRRMFRVAFRLLLRCSCGAHNCVPQD